MSTVEPTPSAPKTTPSAFDLSTIDSVTGQMRTLLTEFEGLVPDLQPHDPRQIKRVAQVARFADPLIAPTINTINTVSIVPPMLFDADRAKQALIYRDYIRPFAQRLLVLGGSLNFSVDAKLAIAGEDILQMYAWAQRAVNGPNGAVLRPWFDEMQRMMKKALNHRKSAPASGPSTPPPAQGFLAIRHGQLEPDELELPESIYDLFADFDEEH
jgi:hypothetical protein